MFKEYVFEKSEAQYRNRILLIDDDDLENRTHFSSTFKEKNFQVIIYDDDLHFRVNHDECLTTDNGKYVIIAKPDAYIPYDIRNKFKCFSVSYSFLFPKLNTSIIMNHSNLNLDLLCLAYNDLFDNLQSSKLTEDFIEKNVYSRDNAEKYLRTQLTIINAKSKKAKSYLDWFEIANEKAAFEVLSVKFDINIKTEDIQSRFKEYIHSNYGKLSSCLDNDTPVLGSNAMEYINGHSKKFVIIVMDGMSEFDWYILSESFKEIIYKKSDIFAMIPTTTSISRQCLLSNKYPCQLKEPWKQSEERSEFIECAKRLGYSRDEIDYKRGYDASFSASIKCGAIIINDIDNKIHDHKQNRKGMFNYLNDLNKLHQLHDLTKRMLMMGFDVYISADHGNVPCTGMGRPVNTGVEVKTKCKRMIVLKDFANKDSMKNEYNMIEYPSKGFYLDDNYDYLICDSGTSFDIKGDNVMSHGGMTLDEVIVPFIKIKADENNG